MSDVTCARCGNTAEGLAAAPLPGPPGADVLARTCSACWKEWLGMQVKVINEYQLSPARPEQYDFLLVQMRAFLNLQGADED